MSERQVTEVTENTREGNADISPNTVTTHSSPSNAIMAQRIIYLILGVIVTLILLRVLFLLLAANRGNVFVDFIYDLSGFFVAPFYGMFNYTPVYGSSIIDISSLVAIIIYALVAWGLARLATLSSSRREE